MSKKLIWLALLGLAAVITVACLEGADIPDAGPDGSVGGFFGPYHVPVKRPPPPYNLAN